MLVLTCSPANSGASAAYVGGIDAFTGTCATIEGTLRTGKKAGHGARGEGPMYGMPTLA